MCEGAWIRMDWTMDRKRGGWEPADDDDDDDGQLSVNDCTARGK